MGLPLAAIPILGDLLGKILDKVAKDKISDVDRMQMELEIQRALREDDLDIESAFRNFVIQYEGAAADMPRAIQILRGSVRPVLTYWFTGLFSWIIIHWLTSNALPTGVDVAYAVKVVFGCTIVTLVFWFGERAVQRSGVADILKQRMGKDK